MNRSNHSYMPGLSGLRALAVLAVIAYHLHLPFASGGLLGVDLFFVLSGYLITTILITQSERSGYIDLKDFWLRRIRRLLPALLLMLGIVSVSLAIFDLARLTSLKQEMLAAMLYYSNWYLIFHEVSYFEQFGPASPLGHLWSLAVEEQFYLLWPLLLGAGLRFLQKKRRILAAVILVALVSTAAMALIYAPGEDPSRVYYGTDTRAFSLLAGAALAIAFPRGKMSAVLSPGKRCGLDLAGIIGFLVVLWMIIMTNQYQSFLYQGGFLLFSVAAACLVAALAHPASALGKIFGWRPLRWIGECSYGIYLWHYPVIVLTSPAVDTNEPDLFRSFIQVAVTISLAALSKHLVEDPIRGERFGRTASVVDRSKPRRKRRSLGRSALRVSVSILLICAVISASTEKSGQTLAVEQIKEPPQILEPEETVLPPKDCPDEARLVSGEEITVIGDSIMVAVEPYLQKQLPGAVIDAKISRQMRKAPEIITALEIQGNLRKIVILALGTNGPFTDKQFAEVLDSLKGAEKILLINIRAPRQYEPVVNELLKNTSASLPDIALVDWYTASSGHDEYFYEDGVHPNPMGSEVYCNLIINALNSI